MADGGSPHDLGHAYAIALRERVLNPIGMPPHDVRPQPRCVAGDDYAVPHAEDITGALHPLPLLEDDTWLVPVAPSGRSGRARGRWCATSRPSWDRGSPRTGCASSRRRIWSGPGSRALRFPSAPGTPPDDGGLRRALRPGLGRSAPTAGSALIWHSGGTLGFSALVTFMPEADLGVVVLTNGVRARPAQLTYAVASGLLELLFDQPATFDAMLTSRLAGLAAGRDELLAQLGQVDPAAVTPYLGRYANPDLGDLTLALRDGKLFFQAAAMRSEVRAAAGVRWHCGGLFARRSAVWRLPAPTDTHPGAG